MIITTWLNHKYSLYILHLLVLCVSTGSTTFSTDRRWSVFHIHQSLQWQVVLRFISYII